LTNVARLALVAVVCSINVFVASVATAPLTAAPSLKKSANLNNKALESVVFTFPEQHSIGWLYALKDPDVGLFHPVNCTYLCEAKGKVTLQSGNRNLALSCNNRALKDPAWLKKIPANSIGLLSLADTKTDDNWLDNLESVPWLKRLHLSKTKITDEGLSKLRNLPRLTLLSLEDNFLLDGSGLKFLSGSKNLTCLYLDSTNLSPSNLRFLTSIPSLECLELEDSNMKDEHLQPLLGLKSLKKLGLRKTQITDAGVEKLTHLPKLEVLDVSYTAVRSNSLTLLSRCKLLKTLGLNGCDLRSINSTSIPPSLRDLSLREAAGVDDSFVLKANLSGMTHFNVSKTKVTGKSIPVLAKNGNFTFLGLSALGLSDKDVRPLSGMRQIKTLILDGNPLTSDGIRFVRGLAFLHGLSLNSTNVDDSSIATLKNCKALRFLSLAYTKISRQGLESLRKSLPNCRIEHNSY